MICPECGRLPLDSYGKCATCTMWIFLAYFVDRGELTDEEIWKELENSLPCPLYVGIPVEELENRPPGLYLGIPASSLHEFLARVHEMVKDDPRWEHFLNRTIQ